MANVKPQDEHALLGTIPLRGIACLCPDGSAVGRSQVTGLAGLNARGFEITLFEASSLAPSAGIPGRTSPVCDLAFLAAVNYIMLCIQRHCTALSQANSATAHQKLAQPAFGLSDHAAGRQRSLVCPALAHFGKRHTSRLQLLPKLPQRLLGMTAHDSLTD